MVLLSPFENNSERMVMKKAIAVMSGIVVSAAISLYAAAPAWPSDFWTQVSNHVNAVAPSGVQISSGDSSMQSAGRVASSSPAYGTAELPFSTVYPTSAESDWANVDTGPVGIVILMR